MVMMLMMMMKIIIMMEATRLIMEICRNINQINYTGMSIN